MTEHLNGVTLPARLPTESGITASTSQSQGNGALTKVFHEISVCANTNDVVTLPPAAAGVVCVILNNGAKNLQMFPASGDNLGAGVDVSEILEPNETIEFIAYDSTNWHVVAETEIVHAEMFDLDRTVAYAIASEDEDHAYHTDSMQAGDLLGWTFDAGGAGTSFPVASIANSPGSGGSQAQITTTGSHGLAVGDIVSLTNMSAGSNAGVHVVVGPVADTTFEIASANSTNATGTMNQAATLNAIAGSEGQYMVVWSASGEAETNNDIFDFDLHVDAVKVASTESRRKFSANTDVGSFGGTSIITIAALDKVSFMVHNTTSSGDLTIRNFALVLLRI